MQRRCSHARNERGSRGTARVGVQVFRLGYMLYIYMLILGTRYVNVNHRCSIRLILGPDIMILGALDLMT